MPRTNNTGPSEFGPPDDLRDCVGGLLVAASHADGLHVSMTLQVAPAVMLALVRGVEAIREHTGCEAVRAHSENPSGSNTCETIVTLVFGVCDSLLAAERFYDYLRVLIRIEGSPSPLTSYSGSPNAPKYGQLLCPLV